MDIGMRLRVSRGQRGISQSELARRLKVPGSTVSRWETNKTAPSLEKVVEVSSILNMSLDEIFLPEEVVNRTTRKVHS